MLKIITDNIARKKLEIKALEESIEYSSSVIDHLIGFQYVGGLELSARSALGPSIECYQRSLENDSVWKEQLNQEKTILEKKKDLVINQINYIDIIKSIDCIDSTENSDGIADGSQSIYAMSGRRYRRV